MVNSKRFSNISIRGRVAFGICCFENAIHSCGYELSDWSIVLSKLWSLTSMQFVDDWLYTMAEYNPQNILSDPYQLGDCEELSHEEYLIIQKISKNAPSFLIEIADDIFYIGTTELYGGMLDNSPSTLAYLQKVLDKMREQM